MLHSLDPSTPGYNGSIGSQGPAPGIRRAAHTDVASGGSLSIRPGRDGSLSFAAGARLSSAIVTAQPTLDPVTPLKTRAEKLRGGNVDARA
jgi:hypothetical protein